MLSFPPVSCSADADFAMSIIGTPQLRDTTRLSLFSSLR